MTKKRKADDALRMFREIRLETFEAVFPMSFSFSAHVFRGQANNGWGLKSTFERAADGIPSAQWAQCEHRITTEFKRRAHHYLSDLPGKDKHLEWLALMQHHGAPTRLLDFTRSFFVALFFAIDGAYSDSTVWAVRPGYLEMNAKLDIALEQEHLTYTKEGESRADEILSIGLKKTWEPGIVLVEPKRLNERLSIQQGLFLFPENLSMSFEENLCTPLGTNSLAELATELGSTVITKVVIPYEFHGKIAYMLSTMNITAATLFPGLDGFARSQVMYMKWAGYDTISEAAKAFGRFLGAAFLRQIKDVAKPGGSSPPEGR